MLCGGSLWHTLCYGVVCEQFRSVVIRQERSLHSTETHGQMCVQQKKRETGGEVRDKFIWNGSQCFLNVIR